jgi:hypothetical protein
MAHTPGPAPYLNIPHARWVIGVLRMLIAVVGKESLLGLVLRQTRSDIASLVRRAEQESAGTCFTNN